MCFASGNIFDVVVDLREESPTYDKCESAILSPENKRQFFIPSGFVHSFLVLTYKLEF